MGWTTMRAIVWRVGEPGVREGLGAVGGLVDADAGHGRAEQVGLARADPHDVGFDGATATSPMLVDA